MKWKQLKSGTYKSECGRWGIQKRGSKWQLIDLKRPKGKRIVLDDVKSKKLCQEEAVKLDNPPDPNTPVKSTKQADAELKEKLITELQSCRLTLDGLAFKVIELSGAIRQLAESEGRR